MKMNGPAFLSMVGLLLSVGFMAVFVTIMLSGLHRDRDAVEIASLAASFLMGIVFVAAFAIGVRTRSGPDIRLLLVGFVLVFLQAILDGLR